MNTNLQTALNKINEQQKKLKSGSPAWCVGEQLMDILREDAAGSVNVAVDIDQKGMGLEDCEKKIAAFAQKNKQGNMGFCGPADSDRIIREFYGLPQRNAEPIPLDRKDAPEGGHTKRKLIRLEDFM